MGCADRRSMLPIRRDRGHEAATSGEGVWPLCHYAIALQQATCSLLTCTLPYVAFAQSTHLSTAPLNTPGYACLESC
jgi:hypothetical protein